MTVIKAENISKAYQLGQFSTGTLSRDIERWWAIKRGKEDPFLKIGETNDRSKKGKSDIVWSLKDINFEIQQGDAVGIIGRNGAGKSTLLKILSQITSPTTGTIKIKGRIASLLEVGTGFHPELSGRENIFLNGAILGMRKKEITRKFDEIVDFSGVERYIDTPVKRYSSGMYVRLAFAVAAHLESEILIVDEVLAVGDAEFQKKCLGKMGDISKGQGRTVLFVSHNLNTILDLCPTSILLSNGQLQSFNISETIVQKYQGKTNYEFIIKETSINKRIERCRATGNVCGKVLVKDIECTHFPSQENNFLVLLFTLVSSVDIENDNLFVAIGFQNSPNSLAYGTNKYRCDDIIKKNVYHKLHLKIDNLSSCNLEYAFPYIVLLDKNNSPYDVIDAHVADVPSIKIFRDPVIEKVHITKI
ncbi:MAG: ABC transporter ATP-binding protein [Chitinophagaceae bacterium]|nr:ABC transporter ATP-binding protein [Chitinophagaceae bacterium]